MIKTRRRRGRNYARGPLGSPKGQTGVKILGPDGKVLEFTVQDESDQQLLNEQLPPGRGISRHGSRSGNGYATQFKSGVTGSLKLAGDVLRAVGEVGTSFVVGSRGTFRRRR